MYNRKNWFKVFTTFFIIWTFLLSSLTVRGQDLVVSRDISGGSSVFGFPKSRKARQPKRYKPQQVRRTVAQRKVTRRKIRRQYNTLAKVTTRRKRIVVVEPLKINYKTPQEGSVAFVGVGQYYLDKEDIDESLKAYREAVSLDNKNNDAKLGLSDIYTRKADVYLDEEKYLDAKGFYIEALKYNDENSAAYAGLGEVYDETDESKEGVEQAIKNYKKALEIDSDLTEVNAPLGILYYQQGKIAEADSYLTKALKSEPDNAETQYFLGLVRFTQNQNEEALTAFRNVVKADATNAEAHFYIGEILDRLGRSSEAITEYEKAIQLDPNYVDAWFSLGVIYYNNDDFQKSVDAYEKTVKLKNDYAEAQLNLADAYRQLADAATEIKPKFKLVKDSMTRYELALSLIENNPDNAEVFKSDLGDIYNKYGYIAGQKNILAGQQGIKHNWDTAIEILTKAAEANNSAIDYTNLGWAHYNSARGDLKTDPQTAKSKLEMAKSNLEKAFTMNPNEIVTNAIRVNMGVTLIDMGDFDGAIKNLTPVTKERKEWAFANYYLGVAYFKKGSIKESIEYFEDAVKTDKDYIDAYSGLGNAYLKLDDGKNVKKVIDSLVNLKTRPALIEAKNLQTALRLKGFNRN